MKTKYMIATAVLMLAAVNTALCQNDNGKRKIIDTHFHALEWNSFGNPPPPNEITGIVPKIMSDSEERSAMLAELKKNNVVKAITSGVPVRQAEYKQSDKDRIIEGLLVENEKELPDTTTFV